MVSLGLHFGGGPSLLLLGEHVCLSSPASPSFTASAGARLQDVAGSLAWRGGHFTCFSDMHMPDAAFTPAPSP